MVTTPALASGETITNFKSVTSLDASDILHVHEKISVDFGGISHHGIYRDVPVIRRGNEGIFYYTFALVSTSDEVQQSSEGDYTRLRLGNAGTTMSGIHDYTVDYTLTPVVLAATDHDRVFLNGTGDQWEYPILHAEYDLTLPVAPQSKPICYAGAGGTIEQFCSVTQAGNTVTAISTQTLQPGSGLSLDANLPSNSFTSYLVAGQKPANNPIDQAKLYGIYTLTLLAISLALWGLVLALKDRLRKRAMTVVAQYEAPDGLTPAQIGLLSDNKAALQELSATILDLAVRGYIKITLVRPKSWYRKANYRFDQLKPFDDLKDYEKKLITVFFYSMQPTVTMDDVTTHMSGSSSAAIQIQLINKQIGQGLKDAGYYNYTPSGQGTEILAHSISSIGLVSYVGFITVSSHAVPLFAFLILLAFFAFQVWTIVRRPKLTDTGLEEWAKVEGFKLYLKVAESDRLNFSDAPVKTPERFNALLPYAVALGVEKEWAKQFDGIDLSQSSSWYAGEANVFTAAAFASAFSDGFAGAMSSGFSGSSGGGSVGGGGGGGGGGGW